MIVSIALLTAHFSEARSGPLHSIQRGVSAGLAPISEGASRALKPVRDLVNWFDETFDARGENQALRSEVEELRTRLTEAESALRENAELRRLIGLERQGALAGYEPVTARVIGRSPSVWYSTVQLDRGSSSGVRVDDPVLAGGGLAGRVTDVTAGTAQATLITDHRSAVSARALPDGPLGVVKPEVGAPGELLLDFVESDRKVKRGATLATAGSVADELESLFPPGIPIGEVVEAEVGEQAVYQRVHVQPFADLRDFELVQVLTGGEPEAGAR